MLSLAQVAYQAGNYEESLSYCTRAIEAGAGSPEAWVGKALSAARLSTLANPRFKEMRDLLQHGLELADEQHAWPLRQQAASSIVEMAGAYFDISWGHYQQFPGVGGAWPELADRSREAVELLRYAMWLDPTNRDVPVVGMRVAQQSAQQLGPLSGGGANWAFWSQQGRQFFLGALFEFRQRFGHPPPQG